MVNVSDKLKGKRFICLQCYNSMRRNFKSKLKNGEIDPKKILQNNNETNNGSDYEIPEVPITKNPFRRATTDEHAAEIVSQNVFILNVYPFYPILTSLW